MNRKSDAVVIGAGPSGLAAALSLKKSGIKDVLIVEREDSPGGILQQCIHNGFGLHRFHEELTGPEYAERYIELCRNSNVEILLNSCVVDISHGGEDREGGNKSIVILSEDTGLYEIESKAVILAMGCRERNRGNINTPGSRPAGVMTAGLAQKLVNILGCLPGKEVIILGSGDIGLIMARRLTWEGAHVKAVVEIQPYPGGLSRNIVQCLNDFNIPLYLSHTITNIFGNKRVEGVEVCPIDGQFIPQSEESFTLSCDALLLSVGLIPENELSIKAGIKINPVTGGPVVNPDLMTNLPGIFACGNVLHVHDLVDWVSKESEYCGEQAAKYIRKEMDTIRVADVEIGNLVRYVLPSQVKLGERTMLSLRPLAPAGEIYLYICAGEKVLYKRKFHRILPGEMIRVPVRVMDEKVNTIKIYFGHEMK